MKEHSQFNSKPSPAKYDLKDTFFREKYAQKPKSAQRPTRKPKKEKEEVQKPSFIIDRGILFLKLLEQDSGDKG